ncbi:MAG: hypothetical protein QXE05_06095 [Nitrososphaeria archaeon]
MIRINVTINEDLDKRFRGAIVKKYGMKKGNISMVLIDIMEKWIAEVENENNNKIQNQRLPKRQNE